MSAISKIEADFDYAAQHLARANFDAAKADHRADRERMLDHIAVTTGGVFTPRWRDLTQRQLIENLALACKRAKNPQARVIREAALAVERERLDFAKLGATLDAAQ